MPSFSTVDRRHCAGVILIAVLLCPSLVPSTLLTAQTSSHYRGSACDRRLPVLKTEAVPRGRTKGRCSSIVLAELDACLLSHIPDPRRGFASRLCAWYTTRSAWGKENKWEPQSGIWRFKVTVGAQWSSWGGCVVVLFMQNRAPKEIIWVTTFM